MRVRLVTTARPCKACLNHAVTCQAVNVTNLQPGFGVISQPPHTVLIECAFPRFEAYKATKAAELATERVQ